MSAAAHRSILISSMPKSGTTWMFHMLQNITGNTHVRLYGDPLVGSEIDTARIIHAHRNSSPWIAMLHLSAGDYAARMFEDCDVTPIVLVRNVYDSIASLHDEIVKVIRSDIPPLTTMMHVPVQFVDWEVEDRLDFLITYYVPWVGFFLNRWVDLRGEKHWVTYDQLLGDTEGTLRRILDLANFSDVDETRIRDGMAQFSKDREDIGYQTRFNQGVVGRGNGMLSDKQKAAVLRAFSYYPDLDLQGLGVLTEEQLGPPG